MLNDIGIFAGTQDDEIQQVRQLGEMEYRSLACSLRTKGIVLSCFALCEDK